MDLLEVMIKRGITQIGFDVEQYNVAADEPHNPADRVPVLFSVTIDGVKQVAPTQKEALLLHGFSEQEATLEINENTF